MIEYGVQRADGSGIGWYAGRRFAELDAPKVPGEVVYRIDGGTWLPLPDVDTPVAHSDGVTVVHAVTPSVSHGEKL